MIHFAKIVFMFHRYHFGKSKIDTGFTIDSVWAPQIVQKKAVLLTVEEWEPLLF